MSHYDDEIAVTRLDDNHYRGHVHGSWNIGDNPNGGYLVSIALNALLDALPHPDPVSVTTHFLRPGSPDADCDVTIDIVRTGRTLSTARATLSQDGKERITMLAACADLDTSAGVDTPLTLEAPTLPAPEDCVQRSEKTQGLHLPILSRLDTRLDPSCAKAGESGRARMAGMIRFSDERDPDTRSLLLFTDAFPPSPLPYLGLIGWVPSLELTVHVRRRPAPGWIFAEFESKDLNEGRMLESGALWDSTGALVAQSRQLALVMNRI
ncbi:MAG: thioesterase family protein [Pseudomonadota bacterium]